jgi:hypothetical protein
MTFEEDFPSLKDKFYWLSLGNQDGYDNFLSLDTVTANCLDKQRVKKIISSYGTHEGSSEIVEPTIINLLNELKL